MEIPNASGLIHFMPHFIVLPGPKNNNSREVPISETFYRILSEMPE